MKNYIKKITLCTLILMASCENSDEFLNRVNPNQVTPGNYWNTEADVEKGLNAAYSSLVFGQGGSWRANFGRFFAWASVYRSDEYYANEQGVSWGTSNSEFTLDANSALLGYLWRPYWITIFRTNTVIEQVPLIEGLSDEKKNELIGEAEFLRGISYFYLINLWESIPLITSVPVTEEDRLPFPASREAVWEQIITDFTNAKSNLSTIKTRDAANLGRATWGAAVGHLGKAYLYTEEWQKASNEFDELIGSEIYDLVPNYRDNGTDLNENNIESIFEAQIDHLAGGGFFGSWRARDGGPKNFSRSDGRVEPWLVDTFMEETTIDGEIDPRAHATLIFPHPNSTLYGGLTYQEAYGTLDPNAPAYWKKYRNVETNLNDNSGGLSSINDRIMRFGDILLLHAEAENEANGPTIAAQTSFNRVRTRANMSLVNPLITKEDFREVIRRERVLELSGEDNRWMDLKRWGILEERFNDPSVLSGANFDINKHEYYPIPALEMFANPNLDQYADY